MVGGAERPEGVRFGQQPWIPKPSPQSFLGERPPSGSPFRSPPLGSLPLLSVLISAPKRQCHLLTMMCLQESCNSDSVSLSLLASRLISGHVEKLSASSFSFRLPALRCVSLLYSFPTAFCQTFLSHSGKAAWSKLNWKRESVFHTLVHRPHDAS